MPKREKWFKVLLTQQEFEKLQAYAESQGWNMSQAFREWIKELPCS
ncbi:DNA-binding protein [Scytonema sp. UIC 10036]|nr:DNA-binding protein [Scytonema sp. UIC 10036]MUG95767.1 DNA-binding protein [Scytonema sp. UIC 10036]